MHRHGKTHSSKFEEACAKISLKNQRFLSENDNKSSDEEENDEFLNEADLLEKMFLTYSGGDGSDGELERIKQLLKEAIQSGGIVCLICISLVKKTEAIWSCKGCYTAFHLPCLQKWARDSMNQKQIANIRPEDSDYWDCPKCRFKYRKEECPIKYNCYCGQVQDPSFDPWLVPHSCGQVCNRSLLSNCGHTCKILCHPGPCPPCPQMIMAGCNCGREKPQSRRCSNPIWSCHRACDKLLTCKLHKCLNQCHPGECMKCNKQSLKSCLCGNKKEKRPCFDAEWTCEKVCGKPLTCGYHKCEVTCHWGPCDQCSRAKFRSCPCGKNTSILPCNVEVPPCGDTCNKTLICGLHYCAQRCHYGDCGLCVQMITRSCRCGLKQKSLPCHKEFLCETKCKKSRDCGKHPCSRKCCDGKCSTCEQVCGRTLNCGNHKCSSRCHPGPCYPCPLFLDNKCRCGKTVVKVACGRKNVSPPKCRRYCDLNPPCHHDKIQSHRCHFGDCPQCQLSCSKTLGCGHVCERKCHSSVPTTIQVVKKRAGPWEPPVLPKVEIVCQPCPPCSFPINVICMGEHENEVRPCAIAQEPFSCMRKCERRLACTNHICELVCHKVENAAHLTEAGSSCVSCDQPCSMKRPKGCTHSCLKPCHPKPCPPCRLMQQHRCHCQTNLLYIDCFKWTGTKADQKFELLSCGDRCPKLMSCGHRCFSKCHLGPCTESRECKKKVVVRCKCKRIKQDYVCYVVHENKAEVVCDAECQEKILAEMKRKNEEVAKQDKERQEKELKELEIYKRKMDGKKRKQKKVKELKEDKPLFRKQTFWIFLVSVIIVLLAFLYIILIR